MVLVLVALSTRVLPIAMSPFPFNNDGITECKVAEKILDSGHLDFSENAYYLGSDGSLTPAYNLLIAFMSSFMGSSPFWVAQFAVGMISITTIVGTYLISLRMTSNPQAAFASALVLVLFGTFVFLTGSAWKESLGIALLVLLVYSYIKRDEPRMLYLAIVLLVVLPLVHHFAAFLAYLSIWFMTVWAMVFALTRKSVKLRHSRDFALISIVSVASYSYYSSGSFVRLSLFDELVDVLFGIAGFVSLMAIAYWYMSRKSRTPLSFAPVLASGIAAILVLDYLDPLFGYKQGTPMAVLVLIASMSVVAGIGWYGCEILAESNNRHRAVPLGLLLPLLLVFSYALLIESGYSSHWMIYRTFDFADLPIALGVGAVAGTVLSRPTGRRWLLAVLLCALVLSFPFSYLTGPLTGVRHDTQTYEYDALSWVNSVYGDEFVVRSDERLAYTSQALFGTGKDPSLPRTLSEFRLPEPGRMNFILEEWFSDGVNDYPEGHVTLDESYVMQVMAESNVLFVGGPSCNNIIGFATRG